MTKEDVIKAKKSMMHYALQENAKTFKQRKHRSYQRHEKIAAVKYKKTKGKE